jgi:hypothetical protein
MRSIALTLGFLLVFTAHCSRKVEPVPEALGAYIEIEDGLIPLRENVSLRSKYERFMTDTGTMPVEIHASDIRSFLLYLEDEAPHNTLYAFGWGAPATIAKLETYGIEKIRTVELDRSERTTDQGVLVKLVPKDNLPLGFNYLTLFEEGNEKNLLRGFILDVVPEDYELQRERITSLYEEFYSRLLNSDMHVDSVLTFVTPGERESARETLKEHADRLRKLTFRSADQVSLRIMKLEGQPDRGALIVQVTYEDKLSEEARVDTFKCPVQMVDDQWYLFEFRRAPYYHF